MSLIASVMPMKLDVFVQTDEQDLDTGAIKKSWHYQKTMSCHAKGVISNAASRSSDVQNISGKYTNQQVIQLRTIDRLTIREKINNIRDSKNNVLWKELNYPSESSTVFEVFSSTPIVDPFGNIVGYNSMAMRSENQQIGI